MCSHSHSRVPWLNQNDQGKQLYAKIWNSMWPIESKLNRQFYSFGMETLLKLDLNGSRRFFDAFFDLKPCYWQGFLSSRLNLKELAWLSISLFGHASNPRFDHCNNVPSTIG
ncbi:hypothetical protein Ahy_A01g003797 [Arachis hypogaea]|uniref:Uncharacterized protein n=1 Tax=Arachis hypogaea TaxID=3818 RepID=A0A445EUC2_ARAHY|nr:hypothetical protein Ahy_A01g003797 [Arachis hypogaea]